MPEISPHIDTYNFHLSIQSATGNLYFTDSSKQQRYFENVYAELAMRDKESEVKLADNIYMRLFQKFSVNENVFAQTFVNLDENHVWIQKIRASLNNFEIMGVKNQKKPVEVRVEPKSIKTVIIHQINGKPFQFVGGQGDYRIERASRF